MISKNKIKYIRSLELKKNRNKEGKFVAEGFKVVDDLLALQPADLIVATGEWLRDKHFGAETEVIEVTDEGEFPATSATGACRIQTGNIRRLLY